VRLTAFIASLLVLASTGCVVGGGYSSDRGRFLWPGTLLLFVLMVVLLLIFRRPKRGG
jgi:hypothetical protein